MKYLNCKREWILVLLTISITQITGCSASRKVIQTEKANHKTQLINQDVMSVLWYQHSAEARALYYQAFNVAKRRLKKILKQDNTKRKKAVVVDIDETIFNNSPYEAMTIKDGVTYPVGWKQWVASAQAKATPGSVSFLDYAVKHGVDVYYISNRKEVQEAATLKNLKELDFPQAESSHVLLKTDTSDKTARKQRVAETHQIVLLCGDNLGDFSQMYQNVTSSRRNALVDSTKNEFGKRFIILPNPMYGEWEGAVYGYNYRLSDSTKAVLRKHTLHDFHLSGQ